MNTQARLDNYLAAEAAVLNGQEFRYGERSLKMADLAEIRKGIAQCRRELAAESATRSTYSGMGSFRHRTGVFD